jgi:hypothetical protein
MTIKYILLPMKVLKFDDQPFESFLTFRTFREYGVKGPDFCRTTLPHLIREVMEHFFPLLGLTDKNRLEQEESSRILSLKGSTLCQMCSEAVSTS